jgi:O-acetyl-ADP-ribose deacetylase (regulator of RNase III)
MTNEIIVKNTKIILVKGDITQEKTDVIVNAANSSLMGGGGVDGAIHRVGGTAILEECKAIISKIGRLAPGDAVITTGGDLAAKFVIHTVGPIWRGGNNSEPEILAGCYTESLKIATLRSLRSISFPAISTGAYSYPQIDAARIAIDAVINYINSNKTTIEYVHFVVVDSASSQIYNNELMNHEVNLPGT